jgi:hypothetical protein
VNLSAGKLRGVCGFQVDLYRRCRSFQQIADTYGLHRPDIRRCMRQAASTLMANNTDMEAQSLGNYIFSTVDKASPMGAGYSNRQLKKVGDITRSDSNLLGEFRINVEHEDFDQMFSSRAIL